MRALTIAGSDSGGGAGIQADLKTFAAIGVHGTSVVTCATAQNPRRILGIEALSARLVRQQLAAVFEELRPRAIKTGMLYSAGIMREVASFLRQARPRPFLVVDPVLVATSGAPLVRADALLALRREILPLGDLVMPNISEAETLTGLAITEPEHMRSAALALHHHFGCAVLLKGGHLRQCGEAVDFFFDGHTELMLSAARLPGAKLHGAGCTYSAAVTAYRARGLPLKEAVQRGKEFITNAIHNSRRIGRHRVLWPESI